jgi:ribosomal protein S18 acetylase RimI-like enzyme
MVKAKRIKELRKQVERAERSAGRGDFFLRLVEAHCRRASVSPSSPEGGCTWTATTTMTTTAAKSNTAASAGGAKENRAGRRGATNADAAPDPAESFASSSSSSTSSPSDLAPRDGAAGRARAYRVEALASASEVPGPALDACLELFRANMADRYRRSSFGLDLEAKKRELAHPRARYLLVFFDAGADGTAASAAASHPSESGSTLSSSDEDPAGGSSDDGGSCCRGEGRPRPFPSPPAPDPSSLAAFAHYRFCLDDDEAPTGAVLYVYEIQVRDRHAGRGVGTFLMNVLHDAAGRLGLDRVALTALKSNEGALRFYKEKLGFELDDTDPSVSGEEADYEILSKPASTSGKRAS